MDTVSIATGFSSSEEEDESNDGNNQYYTIRRNSSNLAVVPGTKRKHASLLSTATTADMDMKDRSFELGWRSKTDLLAIAKRHNGMAIQYRILHNESSKPINDHNSKSAPKIQQNELIVQSRFVCASGNAGGNSYRLLHWKLPGSTTTATKKRRSNIGGTIYTDTRPWSYDEDVGETRNPIITIDKDVNSESVRQLIKFFLMKARPSSTLVDFCNESGLSLKDVIMVSTNNSTKDVIAENDDIVSNNEDGDDYVAEESGDYYAQSDEEDDENIAPTSSPEHSSSSSIISRKVPSFSSNNIPGGKSKPLSPSPKSGSDNEAIMLSKGYNKSNNGKSKLKVDVHPSPPNKRVLLDRNGLGDYSFTKRKRPRHQKTYAGARRRHQKVIAFSVGSEEENQYFGLIEGLADCCSKDEQMCGLSKTRTSSDAANTYAGNILAGNVEALPQRGRLFEIPSKVRPGPWTAELLDTATYDDQTAQGRTTTTLTGIWRGRMDKLKECRILYRHVSAKALGPLVAHTRKVSNKLWLSGVRGIFGGGNKESYDEYSEYTISIIDPSHRRMNDFTSQRVLTPSVEFLASDNYSVASNSSSRSVSSPRSFIGSLSLINFEGFLSSYDATAQASNISSRFLEGCRVLASSKEGIAGRILLPIPSFDESRKLDKKAGDDDSNTNEYNLNEIVGVSFPCKIELDEEYKLLIARDDDENIVAIDVVFRPQFELLPHALSEKDLLEHTKRMIQESKEDVKENEETVELKSPIGSSDALLETRRDADVKTEKLDASKEMSFSSSSNELPLEKKGGSDASNTGTKKVEKQSPAVAIPPSIAITPATRYRHEHKVSNNKAKGFDGKSTNSAAKKVVWAPSQGATPAPSTRAAICYVNRNVPKPVVTPCNNVKAGWGSRESENDSISMLEQSMDDSKADITIPKGDCASITIVSSGLKFTRVKSSRCRRGAKPFQIRRLLITLVSFAACRLQVFRHPAATRLKLGINSQPRSKLSSPAYVLLLLDQAAPFSFEEKKEDVEKSFIRKLFSWSA